MGFIVGFFAKLIKIILYFLIFFALIVLIPNLPPYTKFSKIELEPTLPREGALAINSALNNVKKLYENKLLGPETFQVYDGELYTSLATGEIVKVSPGGHVTFVTKIGQPCTGLIQEHICGRPLGFKIDEKNKQLYVADTYLGIWKVDMKTDKKQLLVSPSVEVQGCQPKLLNDLVLDKDGNLYYTVSSCDFQLKDGTYTFLADPSGRILQYNAAKNASTVLCDNLWFPNGITISPDNDYLLITETYGFKIAKYYIRGPKKGQKEALISGLPGLADSIRALPDGSGVLVALYSSVDDHEPLLIRTLSSVPIVRKFLARMQRLIEIPFEFLDKQFPHIIFEEIVYYIGSFKSISGLAPPLSGLLQIDWNGKVIASYYNTDKSIKHISDGIVYNDVLHLANPHVQNFIGGSPAPPLLKQAFVSKKQKEEVKKTKDEPQLPAGNGKQKESIIEKKEFKAETIKPPKPTPTIAKTNTKPEEKVHTTQAPEEKRHTTPKPEAKKYSTPKPEQKRETTKPEERKKETTQKNESSKQAESKPTTVNKQADSQEKSRPKPTESKPSLDPKPIETKIEKPKAQPKTDTSKITDQKSTTSAKQVETKTTTPTNQIDENMKVTKQRESYPKSKQSDSKESIKTEDKLPSEQTPPPKQVEPKLTPQKNTESKPPTSKSAERKSTPSQQQTESESVPSKQTESKPKESIEKTKFEQKTKSDSEFNPPLKQETKKSANTKPTPDQIPVKEDIQSDTEKPLKQTIKVIKKEGPTEIPNLNP